MNDNLIVGTGWHSTRNSPRNSNASKRIYQADYLVKVWAAYVEQFIQPKKYVIWQSDCEILPWYDETMQIIQSLKPGDGHHNNDYISSFIAGANYAYLNGCDFVYIEQDCLVWGLDKAIEWARGKDLVYGEHGLSGWAETSFVYMDHKYVPEFIEKALSKDWMFWIHGQDESPFGEMFWDEIYLKDAVYWPFGYGRKRPINFKDDIFYAQHLIDKELDAFIQKGEL